MSKGVIKNDEYKKILQDIKFEIQNLQIKASISVNRELLKLYWNIAEMIVKKQEESSWGDKIIEAISSDLKIEFPQMKGFFKRNIMYMRKWYFYWDEIVQQAVAFNYTM